jgi:hypothetical protein
LKGARHLQLGHLSLTTNLLGSIRSFCISLCFLLPGRCLIIRLFSRLLGWRWYSRPNAKQSGQRHEELFAIFANDADDI